MLSKVRARLAHVSTQILGISALIALLFMVGCTSSGGSAQFAVTTASGQLATAIINSSYPQTTLTAANGTAPYMWAWSGNTPPGMSLSSAGILSGSPTSFGTFSFTVTVTDSATPTPHTATASLSVLINPALASVSLNPTSVVGGLSSMATVTLNGAAAAAASVTLSSSSASATVPATVSVPAGMTTATFQVTTTAVSALVSPTITATYGVAKTATLAINPPTVKTVVLAPTTVTGGSSSSGTVTLTGPAATGGDSVALSSDNAAAQVPATVTVTAGQSTAQFTVTTSAVASSAIAHVQGSFNSSSQTATLTVVPAPTITSFTSAAATITSGTSTTLTGVFTNGTGNVSNGVGVVNSGTGVSVSPTATTTYTLTVTNAAGTAVTRQVTVTVVSAPTISSFTPAAATITAGTSTTLTAVFSNGTGSVDNSVGTVISGTPVTVSPASTTTYTLTVTNLAGATVTKQTMVTVVAAPSITSFVSGASSITAGTSTTLTAVFSNGTGSVNNGVGVVTTGVSANISPASTTTYTLTVTNAANTSVTMQVTVTVVAAPTITSFTPTAAFITAGTSTKLTAVFAGGSGTIDNGVGAVTSGTGVTVSPAVNTTYTLTVTNTASTPASVNLTATVNVVAAPAITSFAPGLATIVTGSSTTLTAVFTGGTGSINNGVGSVTSGTPVNISPTATTTYTLTVTNSATVPASVTSTASVTVDVPPSITSGSSSTFTVGTNGTFMVTSTGNPTAALTKTGALPNGVSFVDNGNGTATISGIPATGTTGSYPITITANNGISPNGTQAFTLNVVLVQAPAITSAGSVTFTAGAAGTFTVTTTGSPTPALTKTGSLPAGVNFTDNGNGTATISGTAAAPGSSSITITANNGVGTNATQTFTFNAVAAPSITSFTAAASTITAGTATTLTGVFAGGTGSVNNSVGTVTTGTAASVSPGVTTTYTLTVTNAATTPVSATAMAMVTVVAAPTINTFVATSTTIVSGTATTLTPTFSNGTGSISPSVGTVTSGTGYSISPTSTTTYTLTVTNTAGSKVTSTVTITVDTPPSITSNSGTGFDVGADGSFTVTTTGSPTPSLSFTGSLPSAITFVDNHNGTATISGIPASGTAGTYPITITASNGVGSNATQTFTLAVVTGVPTVDITVPGPAPLQAGGAPVTFTISVTNDLPGDTPTVTSFTQSGVACTAATCGSFGSVLGTAGSGSYIMVYTPPTSLTSGISPTVTVTPSVSGSYFAGTTGFNVFPAGLIVTGPGTRIIQTNSGVKTFVYEVYNDIGNAGVNLTLTASGFACQTLSPNSCGTLGTPVVTTSGTTTTTTVTYTPPSAVPNEPYDRPRIQATSVAESAQFHVTEFLLSSTAAPAPLSIPFSGKLDSALTGGAPISISATGNDTGTTMSVAWTLTAGGTPCTGGVCGTLSTPTVITNGINVDSTITYTPPASVPSGASASPTITAAFTDNASATDNFTFNIVDGACGTGNEKALNGNYAFLLQGAGPNQGYLADIGSFVANGSGLLTSGLQDLNRSSGPAIGETMTGTYSVGSDNRGCLTWTRSDGSIVTFRIALGTLSGTTATQGSMISFNDDTGQAFRLQGTLVQQTTTAFSPGSFTGTYAFGREGVDDAGGRFVIGGLFTANGVSTISNVSSDYDDAFTGAVNVPGPGSGTFSLASNAAGGRGTTQVTTTAGTDNLVFYVVSASELLSMSTDTIDSTHPIDSGKIMLQTGPFTTTALNSSGFAFYSNGIDNSNGGNDTVLGQAAITTNGNATVTIDENDNGVMNPTNTGVAGPEQVQSLTFSLASTGRMTAAGAGNHPPIFYMVDSTQGFLINTDSSAGFGYIQKQTPTSFSTSTVSGAFFFAGGAPVTESSYDSGTVTLTSGSPNGTVTGTDDSTSPNFNLGGGCTQGCGGGLQPNSSINQNGGTTTYSFSSSPTAPGQGNVGSNSLAYIISPSKVIFMQTSTSQNQNSPESFIVQK